MTTITADLSRRYQIPLEESTNTLLRLGMLNGYSEEMTNHALIKTRRLRLCLLERRNIKGTPRARAGERRSASPRKARGNVIYAWCRIIQMIQSAQPAKRYDLGMRIKKMAS